MLLVRVAGDPAKKARGLFRMRRREFVRLTAGTAMTWPFAARAQQKSMPVVGYLLSYPAPIAGPAPTTGPLHDGLSEAGYVVGQNVAIEYRWAENHYDRLPALATDLVRRKVDVIVTTGTSGALAAKTATATIPIVFIFVNDPVEVGLVASLARPGGNITGFSNIAAKLAPKRLELLAELVPRADVIALLVNPNNPVTETEITDAEEAARAKGVQLVVVKAGTDTEIDAAFAALVQRQAGALVVSPDGLFGTRRDQLVALASRHSVPAIYADHQFADTGGLISFGIDARAVRRQAGIYAGRILKGAKPADLPVQQPTKFELVINLKTAKTLGLTVPQSILARADEVIE
jgi:putative ABC transport system substrate-binding protein